MFGLMLLTSKLLCNRTYKWFTLNELESNIGIKQSWNAMVCFEIQTKTPPCTEVFLNFSKYNISLTLICNVIIDSLK